MVEERITETNTQPHTTIIERRGSGGGMMIGLAVLIAVIVGAFFLFNMSQNDAVETKAVSSAAKSVGDAADKAGSAVEKAVE